MVIVSDSGEVCKGAASPSICGARPLVRTVGPAEEVVITVAGSGSVRVHPTRKSGRCDAC